MSPTLLAHRSFPMSNLLQNTIGDTPESTRDAVSGVRIPPTTGSNIVFPNSKTRTTEEPCLYPPFILKTKKGEITYFRVPNQYGWNHGRHSWYTLQGGPYYNYMVSSVKDFTDFVNIPEGVDEVIYSSYDTFLVKAKGIYILMEQNEIFDASTPEEVARKIFPWIIFDTLRPRNDRDNPLLLANKMLKPFQDSVLINGNEITETDYQSACRGTLPKTPFDLPFHNIRFINLVAGEFAFSEYDMTKPSMKVAFNSHRTRLYYDCFDTRKQIEETHNRNIRSCVETQMDNVKLFLRKTGWQEPEIRIDSRNRVFLIIQDKIVVAVSASYPSCFVAADTLVSAVRGFWGQFVDGLEEACDKEIQRLGVYADTAEGVIKQKWSVSHLVSENATFGVPKEFGGIVLLGPSHPDDNNSCSYGTWIAPFMIHSKVCDQLQIDINFDFLYSINNPKACVDRLRFWYINPIISVIRDYQKAMKDTYDGLVEILGYKPYCPLKGGGIS